MEPLRCLSAYGLDRVAGLDLEEVKPPAAERKLDRLAFLGPRLARHARGEEASLLTRGVTRRLERLLAERRLHVLAAYRRSAHTEMDEDLRPEVLADVHDGIDRAAAAAADDGCVLEVLRADAHDHAPPDERP